MPIVDIEFVQADGLAPVGPSLTQTLADAAGRVLGTSPGRTWVRLRSLALTNYAENEAPVAADAAPVFVTVLHAHPPQGDALATEVAALTQAVATCLGRPPALVHVQYAPPGAGRQAFGGTLVS
jgi:phenylpyruvate tautomerase PptA (4-oxalocrotonate tautomerase family)